MKKIRITGLSVLLGFTLAACGVDTQEHKGLGDAPVKQQKDVTVKAWPNGDTFPNVAAFCIGVNGIYTVTREAPAAVVVDDPNCRNGVLDG